MQKQINKIFNLKPDDYNRFLQITKDVKFRKGALILREGMTCKGLYYIDSGVIGLYKVYKGREYFQDFFFEGAFATNIISLTSNQPSNEYLVAIEDVSGKFISKEKLISLYEDSMDFKEFGRLLLEQLLADKTKLSFIRSSLPAKDKYQYIVNEYPHYIQRLPLEPLSSYLGMTRETLSRIRGSIQK